VRWSDLNFKLNTMLVTGGETGTKNHKCRAVPIFPALRGLLERMRDAQGANPSGPLFKIEGRNGVRQALDSACRRVAVPHFSHHSLRHFFCSNAIEAGCDFKVIAEWRGHKDGGGHAGPRGETQFQDGLRRSQRRCA
jgi:integrase